LEQTGVDTVSSAAGTLTLVRRSQVGGHEARRNRITCCHDKSKCPNAIKWIIDRRYYCYSHAEVFFDTHFVDEHTIVRLDANFNEEKPFKAPYVTSGLQLVGAGD
jgi:hypothetical protein